MVPRPAICINQDTSICFHSCCKPQFDTDSRQGTTMEVMGEDLVESEVNVDVPLRNTNNEGVKLKQGNYVAFRESDLGTYL